ECVSPVDAIDVHGVDRGPARLAYLRPFVVDEAMSAYLLGQRQTRRKQHGRPECAVEPSNVLADHMDVGWPDRLEPGLVMAVANRRDVVQECIEPDVDRLFGIERDRDAPGKSLAADRDVLQARFDEIDDLVAAAFWLDEVRVCLVVREQAIAERGKPEEVVLLLDFSQRRVRMVGATALNQVLLGLEHLTAVAVETLIRLLVDVARVVNGLNELATAGVVALFTRLDE